MTQEWRQGDGSGEIEGWFEGEWIHLANVGGTHWMHPDDGKNARYQAWRDEALALMLQAPALLRLCKALARLVNLADIGTAQIVGETRAIIAKIEADK